MSEKMPATASWDTRSDRQLVNRGHSFKQVEDALDNLPTSRIFIVVRGLLVILNEEIAPHPDVTQPNEQDIRYVADRITACMTIIERRVMELETTTAPGE
jgi:hypothetical protein